MGGLGKLPERCPQLLVYQRLNTDHTQCCVPYPQHTDTAIILNLDSKKETQKKVKAVLCPRLTDEFKRPKAHTQPPPTPS